jgi:hypothetical protein
MSILSREAPFHLKWRGCSPDQARRGWGGVPSLLIPYWDGRTGRVCFGRMGGDFLDGVVEEFPRTIWSELNKPRSIDDCVGREWSR